MNIAFWAPQGGTGAASLSALAAAVAAVRFPCRIVALENYLGAHNLGHLLLGERFGELRKNFRQFQAGMKRGDTFLQFLSVETGRRIRGHRCLEVIPDSLYFYPMNQSLSKDIYEYGFMEELPEIMEYCGEFYNAVFWNLEANRNITTPWLLEQAEQVVVSLPGTWEAFQKFFDDYKSLMPKSVLVLQEQPEQAVSMAALLRRIRRKYAISKGQLYGWHVSNELLCALDEGKTVEYVCANYHAGKMSREYEGIRCLRNLVFQLLRKEKNQRPMGYQELNAALLARKQNSPSEAASGARKTAEELWVAD